MFPLVLLYQRQPEVSTGSKAINFEIDLNRHLIGEQLTRRIEMSNINLMAQQQVVFANNEIYHVFNRGVEKRQIFLEEKDFKRFIETMQYYQIKNPPVRFSFRNRQSIIKHKIDETLLVEIICYCLMPNHFHLLIKQLYEGGISLFLSKISNSYAKYFNTKYKRVGPLFQGFFKAVRVIDDRQLLQVSRYIHRNPISKFLVKDLKTYRFSSYRQYINLEDGFCSDKIIRNQFDSAKEYEQFVLNQDDYAKSIMFYEEALLDSED